MSHTIAVRSPDHSQSPFPIFASTLDAEKATSHSSDFPCTCPWSCAQGEATEPGAEAYRGFSRKAFWDILVFFCYGLPEVEDLESCCHSFLLMEP